MAGISRRFVALLAMGMVLGVSGGLFAREGATSQPATQATTRAASQANAHAASGPALPTPDEAISLLKEGNARFQAGKSTHPNMTPPA